MSSSPEVESEKKRKRNVVAEGDELEIDINLPEPPSKKAKRKAKKLKTKGSNADAGVKDGVDNSEDGGVTVHPSRKPQVPTAKGTGEKQEDAKRSEYGIWVGNLSFKTNKDSLKRFLRDRGGIDETAVTRVHLPMSDKQQNKGFAYIDFTTEAVLNIALTLSENLVDGRKVLIKNAKSFDGRPAKTKTEEAAEKGFVSKKPPSKRIFVGNLSFDMTKDELAEHFAQAGKVDDVFLATFEDTGKCKGFGWVTFADVEDAEVAVRGYIMKASDKTEEDLSMDEDEEEDEEEKKKKKAKSKRKAHKPRKWFINKVQGRLLRCEFAEDKQTRYTKRYGKGAPEGTGRPGQRNDDMNDGGVEVVEGESLEGLVAEAAAAREGGKKKRDPAMKKLSKDERQEMRRKKHDARMTAPGQALAQAQRSTAAIVEGKGTKVTFD